MTSRRQCLTVIRLILRMKPGMEPITNPARRDWRIPATVVRLCSYRGCFACSVITLNMYNTHVDYFACIRVITHATLVCINYVQCAIHVTVPFSFQLKLATLASMLCVTSKSSDSRWWSPGLTHRGWPPPSPPNHLLDSLLQFEST